MQVDQLSEAPYIQVSERDQLLIDQLPQVKHIARRIHDRLPQHVALDDLVQAGILGLIDAHEKYDASKSVQFQSYAKFRIRGAILDSLRELDWSPRDLRKRAREMEEARARLGSEFGRAATDEEIAQEMGLQLSELQQLQGELRGLDVGSLQVVFSEDGKDEELSRHLRNSPQEDPYFLCERSELRDLLSEQISNLPDKEGRVLALYYFEELSMKEIGSILGVGESRISQIHSAAMARLRGQMAAVLKRRREARSEKTIVPNDSKPSAKRTAVLCC